MSSHEGQDKRSNTGSSASTATARRSIVVEDNRVDSQALFGEGREIVIAHGADMYRLRLTAQNKLILTK